MIESEGLSSHSKCNNCINRSRSRSRLAALSSSESQLRCWRRRLLIVVRTRWQPTQASKLTTVISDHQGARVHGRQTTRTLLSSQRNGADNSGVHRQPQVLEMSSRLLLCRSGK